MTQVLSNIVACSACCINVVIGLKMLASYLPLFVENYSFFNEIKTPNVYFERAYSGSA